MEKFLFIPPVDDSMPPLGAKQWAWLIVSFLLSLVLFVLFLLLDKSHSILATLSLCALTIATMPMQIYAMNRKGRIVGKMFLILIAGMVIYRGLGWVEKHPYQILIDAFCFFGISFIIWFYITAKGIVEQLEKIESRINFVEAKIDKLDCTIRKSRKEAKEIQSR